MLHNHLPDEPHVVDQHRVGSGPLLWFVIWHRKSYVALGLVIGLALGILYYAMAPRSYESSAQILVVKKRPDTPISASVDPKAGSYVAVTPTEDFLDTHRTVVRSSVVLTNALAKGNLQVLPTFQESKLPLRDLTEGLTVSRDRDKAGGRFSNSQILNISFRGQHQEDLGQVLNAILDSYRDFLNRTTSGTSRETLDLITKARDLVQNDLDRKEKAFVEFQKNGPVTWRSPQGISLYQERLARLDAQRAAQKARAAQIRATLDAVDAAVKEGRARAELLELLAPLPIRKTVMQRPPQQRNVERAMEEEEYTINTATSLEQELIQLQLQENKLLADFGSKHPAVASVHERIQTLRGLIAPSAPLEEQASSQRARTLRAKETMVDLKIGQLQQELNTIRREEASLDVLYESELQDARRTLPLELEADAMRRSIDRSKLLYENILKRLEEIDLISNFGGFDSEVITPPTVPEKVSPRGSIVFPISALLGIMLGLGLVYLAEITDKSFRSPEDVRRHLGLPVMGVIPVHKRSARVAPALLDSSANLDPTLLAWHRPKSKEAEAYRGVRTILYFSTRGGGCKLVQITSPNTGDGKSTLAANLAISIAQSGKRVLLVDADMRRPCIHRLFGIDGSVGFATLLEGTVEPPEAIQETSLPNLSLLPSGTPPSNPAELLTSPRLHQLLAWMREQYDYIVLDTPPLLAVTDPSVVGPQVDGVLLTLRPTKKGRVEAKRSKEILDNLGVNIFGVVVNATNSDQGHYGQEYYTSNDGYYDDSPKASASVVGERAANPPVPDTSSASGRNHLPNGEV